MNNLLTARISIQGERAMLWHAFGPDAIPLEKQERTGVAGNDPEEWKRTVLATADGQLYIEPTYVFGCLVSGAKYTKKGRGSIQTVVAGTLQVLGDIVLFDRWLPDGFNSLPTDKSLPVYLDVRGVKNPANKARNVRYRVAASAGWTCSFGIMWDATVVSRGEMQAVVRDAGQFAGLGDGRSIGYGRFKVQEFTISEAE